jgi:hypothetical protein
MSRKAQSPLEIEWRVMEDLQALDGRHWKEAQGEYHGAYEEMAVWILLEKAEDIEAAHRKFRDVIAPYACLARFTVSYSAKVPEGEMLLEFLDGNAEIDGVGMHALGSKPTLKRSNHSVFRK